MCVCVFTKHFNFRKDCQVCVPFIHIYITTRRSANKAKEEKNNKQFAAGSSFVYFIKQQSKVQKEKENQRILQKKENKINDCLLQAED